MSRKVSALIVIGRTPNKGYTIIGSDGDVTADARDAAGLAIPFGQHWRQFKGARSIKCLDLKRGRYAIGFWNVDDVPDDEGLLWGYYLVVDQAALRVILGNPEPFFRHRTDRLSLAEAQRLVDDCPDTAVPSPTAEVREMALRLRSNRRLIIAVKETYDFVHDRTAQQLMLQVALAVSSTGSVPSFTTLALTRSDKSQILLIPRQHLASSGSPQDIIVEWPGAGPPPAQHRVASTPQASESSESALLCRLLERGVRWLLMGGEDAAVSNHDQHQRGGRDDKPR